jgi:serine/threonine protein kinase
VEIFMGLKEGTLESLVESGPAPSTFIAGLVFGHMLQALDFLAYNDIIHRDVKPENILYVSQLDGQYQFQLGDFGLCNHTVSAVTYTGSPAFMAPEVYQKGGQTSKLDVWSLFVTILWTLDVEEFRQRFDQYKSIKDLQEAVFAASRIETVSGIQEMAIVDPEQRASAAQMLVKCYGGAGLTTPRIQVPALVSSPSPLAAGRSPALAPPAFTTRTVQRKPRLPKNGNIFAAAGQYRVEKSYSPFQAQPARRLQEPRWKNVRNKLTGIRS